MNLAATAVGKDWPMKAIDRILTAAGLSSLSQSGKFKSDTAIELMLKSFRTSIATVDEIGASIFAKMGNRRASSHESSISAVLRELWSVQPDDVWKTSARAGEQAVSLASPALTLMGASTLNEFYKSLTGASIDNGLLNRFTVIMADPGVEERDPLLDRTVIPEGIVRDLKAILPSVGNLDAMNALFGERQPRVHQIVWDTPEAGAAHLNFARRIMRWRESDETASPFLGRTAEMAVRLAMLHAVGRVGRTARVTERDYRWGASVAMGSARFMIEEASLRIGDTEFQSNTRLVLSFIKGAKDGQMKRSEITRKVDGRWEPAMTDKILRGLAEGGQIAIKKGDSSKEGGRKPDVYVWLKEKRG